MSDSETAAHTLPDSVRDVVTTTQVLLPERYALDAPITIQPGCDPSDRDTQMNTNPVSVLDLRNAKIFFDGAGCLIRDANDNIVYRFGVTDEQCDALRNIEYPELPGLTHLLGASMGAHCYYHWIVDILPRLGILQKAGISTSQLDNILVREADRSFQAETLASLGIRGDQILETKHNSHFTCERLLHVTLNNGINLKMNRFVPAWLRHEFRSQPKPGKERVKLYVSRPAGVRRGISNEAELIPILEARGFQIVVMEGMPVKHQTELFARSDVLVSPHGGALTNMLFSRPGIKVVELFSRHVYPFYYGLAQCCGHKYHAILENPADYKQIIRYSCADAVGSREFHKHTLEKSFIVEPSVMAAMLDSL